MGTDITNTSAGSSIDSSVSGPSVIVDMRRCASPLSFGHCDFVGPTGMSSLKPVQEVTERERDEWAKDRDMYDVEKLAWQVEKLQYEKRIDDLSTQMQACLQTVTEKRIATQRRGSLSFASLRRASMQGMWNHNSVPSEFSLSRSRSDSAIQNKEGEGRFSAVSLTNSANSAREVEGSYGGSAAWMTLVKREISIDNLTHTSEIDCGATEQIPNFSELHGSYQILSVDDNPVNQLVVENILTPLGYDVVACMDGSEALDLLSERHKSHNQGDATACFPDLILLDVMMPKISGYECCKVIRSLYNASLVSFQTCFAGPEDVQFGSVIDMIFSYASTRRCCLSERVRVSSSLSLCSPPRVARTASWRALSAAQTTTSPSLFDRMSW